MNVITILFAREAIGIPVDAFILKAVTTLPEDQDSFMEKLIQSVSDWVQYTRNGAQLYEHTCGDLNIADLKHHFDDADLLNRLRERGINHLEISAPDVVPFDTILATEPEHETTQKT